MIRHKRPFIITLAAAVSILVFLSGYMTALSERAIPLQEHALTILANAQWAAIQASNSLLMGISSTQIYLPLLLH